jgi:hypothetical protein
MGSDTRQVSASRSERVTCHVGKTHAMGCDDTRQWEANPDGWGCTGGGAGREARAHACGSIDAALHARLPVQHRAAHPACVLVLHRLQQHTQWPGRCCCCRFSATAAARVRAAVGSVVSRWAGPSALLCARPALSGLERNSDAAHKAAQELCVGLTCKAMGQDAPCLSGARTMVRRLSAFLRL